MNQVKGAEKSIQLVSLQYEQSRKQNLNPAILFLSYGQTFSFHISWLSVIFTQSVGYINNSSHKGIFDLFTRLERNNENR